MAKPVLFDNLGNEITITKAPPDTRAQAEVGRVRDRWAGKNPGEITPELAGRVLRGDADLSLKMMVAKRLLRDPHIYACMRNLVYSVSRLPWDVLPFDEKSAASKKQAAEDKQFFTGLRWLKKLFRYLLFGEFYPFSAAGLLWNRDYLLDGYLRINPVRWKRDDATSSLRLLTNKEPIKGEPINRRGYIIYEPELEPGGPFERGLWEKALWLFVISNPMWAWWARFAESYADPYIWAFFQRPEEKDSVLEAVLAMDKSARGVFPAGTEIKLQEAQRYGTTALYEAIIKAGQRGLTKLILGHVLNLDSESGSGTLAGEGAERVSQENKEGVADNLEETVQEDMMVPRTEWHYGEGAVARGEISIFSIDADPPADQDKRAKVYVQVNTVLASAGKAIDPAQIEDDFEVRTVDLVRSAPADDQHEPATGDVTPQKKQKLVAQSAQARIKTAGDLQTVTRKMVARAAEDFSERIVEIFNEAETLEDAADALVEGYAQLDTKVLASGLRDSTVVAELMGEGDASE
jgi:phage gp29-like protein